MTFTYFPSVPVSTNYPGDDQPSMATNTGSIASIIAVDHVGFNVAGGGQHAQVTFNANNVPSLPTSVPIMFTNNQDGLGNALPGSLSQAFIYSGTSAQSAHQYNVTSTNGSVLLPMGIIMKWGSQSFVGSQSPTVTFANAFPNACFNVQLSLLNTGATQTQNRIATITASGFTANVNASGASTWYWVAIGN